MDKNPDRSADANLKIAARASLYPVKVDILVASAIFPVSN